MSGPVLDTALAPDSEAFRANATHNRALADQLRADVAAAAQGGDTWHVRLMVAPVRRLSCDTGGTTAGRALQSVLVRVAGAAASTTTRV